MNRIFIYMVVLDHASIPPIKNRRNTQRINNSNKSMNRTILIITLLFVLGLAGITMLGNGITGMIVFDDTVKQLCESNQECDSPEVCCFFYEKEAGVCHSEDMCSTITEITKNKEVEEFVLIAQEKDQELDSSYFNQAIFGLMIVAIVAFVLHHYFISVEKPEKKKKQK